MRLDVKNVKKPLNIGFAIRFIDALVPLPYLF